MSAAVRYEWRELALCVGKPPEWWLRDVCADIGVSVCLECPVRAECLADQYRYEDEHQMALPGVWGGTTEKDRRSRHPVRTFKGRPAQILEPTPLPSTTHHGTSTAYKHYGCRCRECVSGMSRRRRLEKQRASEQVFASPDPQPLGATVTP